MGLAGREGKGTTEVRGGSDLDGGEMSRTYEPDESCSATPAKACGGVGSRAVKRAPAFVVASFGLRSYLGCALGRTFACLFGRFRFFLFPL